MRGITSACAAMLSPPETAPRLTADAVIEITGSEFRVTPTAG